MTDAEKILLEHISECGKTIRMLADTLERMSVTIEDSPEALKMILRLVNNARLVATMCDLNTRTGDHLKLVN